MKKVRMLIALFLTIMLLGFTGCASTGDSPNAVSKGEAVDIPAREETKQEFDEASEDMASEELSEKGDFSDSTPDNDTDVGLKNIKIDTAEQELTDEQKKVIEYFDGDYLDVPSYEFLRRYPNVFQDAQINVWGTVIKVVSMDNEAYKLILWLNVGPQDIAWGYANEMYAGQYVVLTGKTDPSVWFMENDALLVHGRYTGVETLEIDGISHTIPTVDVHSALFANTNHVGVLMAKHFDYSFVKTVAETIFGKDIEIREPVAGVDISEETAMINENLLGEIPYYLVELENQSNANFVKYLFGTYNGQIIDAKGPFDSGIERYIEFSADFEHFFLFTHNEGLETLTLAYYDKQFNKLWEREFLGTTTAVYDYTKNNLYIVVNNELYIINTLTGEDTFTPSYVGEKVEVRKIDDGILMVSVDRTDGIMKVALDGNIIWKADLTTNVESVGGLQFVGDNVVVQYTDENWNEHYSLINNDTGEILINAEAIS